MFRLGILFASGFNTEIARVRYRDCEGSVQSQPRNLPACKAWHQHPFNPNPIRMPSIQTLSGCLQSKHYQHPFNSNPSPEPDTSFNSNSSAKPDAPKCTSPQDEHGYIAWCVIMVGPDAPKCTSPQDVVVNDDPPSRVRMILDSCKQEIVELGVGVSSV